MPVTARLLSVLCGVVVIAVVMTMTGRGGGNFYVPLLVAAGQPMHGAAATGQSTQGFIRRETFDKCWPFGKMAKSGA